MSQEGKKPFYKQIWFWAIIAVVIIIGAVAGGGTKDSSKEKASSPTEKTTTQAKTTTKKEVETIKISAADIAAADNANEVSADEQYKNKMVTVTGTVDSIGKDVTDTTYVTLSDGKEYSLSTPQLFFKKDDEIKKVANLKKGDSVTITGKCSGSTIGRVLVKDCTIE